MKLKSVLLASAAVLFAGSAVAADLTNPFYLPGKGQMTSDTKIEYGRTHFGDYIYDSVYASEELAYGLTDNMAIVGTLGNHFDVEGEFNNSHNFDYEIGAKYNMEHGRIKAQVAASYFTFDPQSFVGQSYHGFPVAGINDRWQKAIKGEVKLGADMCNGLMPYASYKFTGQIDSANREFLQSAFLGVHKYAGKWAADAGVRYDFNTDGHNNNGVYAQAGFDYYPMDKLAVGVYGDYKLGGKLNSKIRSYTYSGEDIGADYTVGLRAKVLF